MATGIISTGTFLLGPSWLSLAMLAAASGGLVVLAAALAARLVFFRSSVAADVQAPDRVFGFFTITAGLDVLGVRLALAGHPLATAILAAIAAALWLVLTYGVPASLLLSRARDSVLGGVNGSWLLWIVATQSLSITATILVHAWPSQSALLAPVAVGLWSVGLLLYLIVVALILLRWLTVPMTPATLGPPYWILMGATAISVLAGARDLAPPRKPSGGAGDCGIRGGVHLRAVGVRHLVDPAADHPRLLAARPAALAVHLRAHTVERGVPPWHVQRRHLDLRQSGPHDVHGPAGPVHALGRRRRLGTGRRGVPRSAHLSSPVACCER
jgi:hypothetical protein